MDYKKIYSYLEEWLCAALMAFMACLAFANVLSRYLLHYSISFTEELTLNAFVWVTFLGISLGFKRGSHIVVSLLFNKFSKGIQKLLIIFSCILCSGLYIFLIYSSIDKIVADIQLKSTSDALGIPVYWYMIGITLFSVLIVIRIFETSIKNLRGFSNK